MGYRGELKLSEIIGINELTDVIRLTLPLEVVSFQATITTSCWQNCFTTIPVDGLILPNRIVMQSGI